MKVPGVAWQSEQACVVGMWLAGLLAPASTKVAVVWQALHSPVSGCAGFCCDVGRVTTVPPKNVFPPSWHVVHGTPGTAAWFIVVLAKER